MKFDHEKLKYVFFTFMALIILLLIYSESKAFGFKTESIRQMWYACYNTSVNKEPRVHLNIHAMMCDCVIDKGREWYITEELYYRSNDNTTEMWVAFVDDCKFEIQQILTPQQSI